ncbi:AsmA family protein [Roseomonas eburnea]|uniref:AsmA family protein n=1 Tax=Neoroseomonas eburnea TaxID=1346889 RepID=A0A9X9XBV6_9PROT|nr:AsmA family protein [Neoroseomonas eburnea]MBR0681192.1 AsmA family protein [Neoroseomonas eburnea]
MRAVKWMIGLAGGAVLLLGAGMVALVLALDAGALTPRLVAAIEGATGRTAALGAVSLRPGLTPRLTVEGATLANLPGGSRPEMARIRRMEASLAVLPLLRGEVAFRSVTIDGADILLERLADGSENWALTPPARAATPAPAPAPAASTAPRRPIAIGELLLTDSRVTLPDPRLGTVVVERGRIDGFGEGGPVGIAARLALHGAAATLEAETGPLPAPPGAPWPLRGTLSFGANRLSAEGRLGESVVLAATLPEPAALLPLFAALVPDASLPPVLPPIEAALRLGPEFAPSDILLRLGAADLSPLVPGLALARLELRAPALDAAAELTAEGSRNGLAFRAALGLDAPGVLLPGAPEQPVRITGDITAAEAVAKLSGRIERPRSLSGATLELEVAVPDLAAFAPVLPGPPPLRDLRIEARLAAPGRVTGEIRIAPFRVTAPVIQAEGEVTLQPGWPVGLNGRIALARLDLDALMERVAATTQAPARAATHHAPASPPPAPAPAQADGRVIPDIPLPLDVVRAYRGRLDISADHLTVAGTDWRQVRGQLAMADGSARLTSFSAVTPGGPVHGEATLDAAAAPPAVTLNLRSQGPGIDLAALRRARQEATGIEGRAEIRLELSGRGATTRAVAATLTGEAGMAVVEGRLAHAGLLRLGPDLVGLIFPSIPREGLELRCLALRLSAHDGIARTQALMLETSAGRVDGVAAVNLRTEGLAARLMPDVSLLGVRVRAPVGIGGTLAAPRIGVDPGRAVGQMIGDTVANRLWRDPTVEWLRGQVTGSAPAGDCASQLRIARFGADGPVPPPQRVVPGVPRELQGTTQDLLRGLGGLLGGGRR